MKLLNIRFDNYVVHYAKYFRFLFKQERVNDYFVARDMIHNGMKFNGLLWNKAALDIVKGRQDKFFNKYVILYYTIFEQNWR